MAGYVYLRSEPGLWTVGFHGPGGEWHPESDHGDPEAAANRAGQLNGNDASVEAALAKVTAERDQLLRERTSSPQGLDRTSGRSDVARPVDRAASQYAAGQVAEDLFRHHLEQVETEVEVIKGLLSGARRALDRAGDPPPAGVGYRRWERALQRLDAAYLNAARLLGQLRESSEWQQITAIWSELQQLVAHWRDEAIRRGASFAKRWDERMKAAVVAVAEVTRHLAMQLAERPDPDQTTTSRDALANLISTAHAVTGQPPSASPADGPLDVTFRPENWWAGLNRELINRVLETSPARQAVEKSLSLTGPQIIAAWNASYETGRRFTSGKFDSSRVWELREGEHRFFIDPARVPTELAALILGGERLDPDGVSVASIAVVRSRKPRAAGPAHGPVAIGHRHSPPPPPVSPPPRRAIPR